MKYTVTIQNANNIFSEVIAYAASEADINAYFAAEGKTVIGIREMVSPYIKPGQPVIEIPAHPEPEQQTAEEITDKIVAWFESNEDVFNQAIEELDAWNGYLGDDRYYDMYDFDELHSNLKPSEILALTFYGYDEDTSSENNHTEFNPNRNYFRYNGYGNLVSADYKDYSDHMDVYAIKAMLEDRDEISAIEENDELCALFDALEEAEESEEA